MRLMRPARSATTTLLRWTHAKGRTAQCILRTRPRPDGTTVVIASEIVDNPLGLDVLGDFAGLATTAQHQLQLPDPETLSWYAHHGPHSYIETDGLDHLTAVPLHWDGIRYQDDFREQRRLFGTDRAELLRELALEPVDELLRTLQNR